MVMMILPIMMGNSDAAEYSPDQDQADGVSDNPEIPQAQYSKQPRKHGYFPYMGSLAIEWGEQYPYANHIPQAVAQAALSSRGRASTITLILRRGQSSRRRPVSSIEPAQSLRCGTSNGKATSGLPTVSHN
jgi:hypothetical protein